VNSPFCADEVEYAQGLNKRMVTVLHRAIDGADLHPVLAKLQWLDFREHDGDFQANFAGLLRTLDTDREHLETHTRLLVRSGEWDRRGRDESLLLRGQDLQTAETWLTTNVAVEPQPTGLQQEYIRAGRARQEAEEAAEKKLRRGALIGAIAAIAGISVAAVSGGAAWYLQNEATKATSQARWNVASATQQELSANRKTYQAEILTGNAVEQADQAQRDQQKAEAEAQDAENRATEADGKAQTAAVAQQQAEASAQAADAKAQDAEDRAEAADIKTAEAEKAQRLAQIGTRLEQIGTAALSRFEFDQIGALLRALKVGRELQVAVAEAGISIKAIAEYPAASPIFALQQLQAKSPNSLLAHQREVTSASFNATGDQVVTASLDGTARVWDLKTGQSTPLVGHTSGVTSASFNAMGDQVVTASLDGTARVWDLKTGQSTPLEGHTDRVTSASFNATGDQVVTASNDGTARVWDLKTGQSPPLVGHTAGVTSASFNATGDQVVTASYDRTARVWDLKTGQSTLLEGHTNVVTSASFNATGDQVVTASVDGTARVWDLQGRQLAIYQGSPVALSPDGQRIAAVVDGRVKVYDVETLPELLAWGCQWLHNYLEYGKATDADRAICNLPPRDSDPAGPFESSLGRTLGLVGVSWPERSEGMDG
jgi:WD40 repeat protein